MQLRASLPDACFIVYPQADALSVRAFACPGMPQTISWLPCICPPAREAAGHGHGLGHLTLRCEACSTGDYRDTTLYEPPHQALAMPGSYRLDDAAGRLIASETTPPQPRRPEGLPAAWTVTILMMCPAVCALTTLTASWPPACPAAVPLAARNSCGGSLMGPRAVSRRPGSYARFACTAGAPLMSSCSAAPVAAAPKGDGTGAGLRRGSPGAMVKGARCNGPG